MPSTSPNTAAATAPTSVAAARIVSVAMHDGTNALLREYLLRPDGQEDLRLATYAPSTGSRRWTALLRDIITPEPGERTVHRNVSFTGDYVVRAAARQPPRASVSRSCTPTPAAGDGSP